MTKDNLDINRHGAIGESNSRFGESVHIRLNLVPDGLKASGLGSNGYHGYKLRSDHV